MKVFVLVPVHNRVEHTEKIIEYLKRQTYDNLSIIVIDDGSTDSTPTFLAGCQGITTLNGNGTLWWAGAIALGLSHVASTATDEDFVLLLNNDTTFEDGYIQAMIDTSRDIGYGVVGSVLRDIKPPNEILSIGPVIDVWGMRVWDKWQEMTPYEKANLFDNYNVTAVSGRGALYPITVLNRIGVLRPRLLPHYYADYELSARASRAGIPVVVSTKAVIYTENDFSVEKVFSGFFERYFSERSYRNLIRVIIFWCSIGTPLERLTAAPRLAYQALRRKAYRFSGLLIKAFPIFKQVHARLKELKYTRRLRDTIRKNGNNLRVIIGASSTAMPNWVSTEYPYVNIAEKDNLSRWFFFGTVKAILAEHVWEHMTYIQAQMAIANSMELLEPGGYLRIAVPDGNHPDENYIDYVKPGGYGDGSDDHKVLYTIDSLSQLLIDAGFKVQPLEWFDCNGQFHFSSWDIEKGMVSRSMRFDHRNHSNPTAYTSLIVDAVKPVDE